MKSRECIIGMMVTGLLSLMMVDLPAQGDEAFMGSWEGMFMTDFRTVIELEGDSAQNISGKILMYDDVQQIQDDELFKISIQENRLTFYIMAKETQYKGELDPESGELTGIFIFPDDSEHPLTIKKTDKTTNDEHPME